MSNDNNNTFKKEYEFEALPEGRPDGKDIFEDIGVNSLSSSMYFIPVTELYKDMMWTMFSKDTTCDSLIMIDQRDREYHICFTQNADMKDNGGLYIQSYIDIVAAAIYNRFLSRSHKESSDSNGSLDEQGNGELSKLVNAAFLNKHSDISPDQFHFYIHHPERYGVGGEAFHHVDMDHKNGKFTYPKFSNIDVIPTTIHYAYEEFKMRAVYSTDNCLEVLSQSLS